MRWWWALSRTHNQEWIDTLSTASHCGFHFREHSLSKANVPQSTQRAQRFLCFFSVNSVSSVVKKGEGEELHQVIAWLTGFDDTKLIELIEAKATFDTFFKKAKLHPNADQIKGLICGYRIEEIDNPLTKQVRYLDKLVDELAKGRKMEKILREA